MGDKACTNCGCVYPPTPDHFYPSAYTEDGLKDWCKVCDNDQSSIYYYNHHQLILEARRERYYAAHDDHKAYFRAYRRQRRAKPVGATA